MLEHKRENRDRNWDAKAAPPTHRWDLNRTWIYWYTVLLVTVLVMILWNQQEWRIFDKQTSGTVNTPCPTLVIFWSLRREADGNSQGETEEHRKKYCIFVISFSECKWPQLDYPTGCGLFIKLYILYIYIISMQKKSEPKRISISAKKWRKLLLQHKVKPNSWWDTA